MTPTPTVPAGTHVATLVESVLSTTKTGKPMLTLLFEVDGVGRVPWFGFFTDRAIEITRKALTALDFDLEAENYDLARINGTQLLVGRRASIVVEEEADDRQDVRARVRWVNRLRQKLADGDVAALSATLRERSEGRACSEGKSSSESVSDVPF